MYYIFIFNYFISCLLNIIHPKIVDTTIIINEFITQVFSSGEISGCPQISSSIYIGILFWVDLLITSNNAPVPNVINKAPAVAITTLLFTTTDINVYKLTIAPKIINTTSETIHITYNSLLEIIVLGLNNQIAPIIKNKIYKISTILTPI